MCRFSKSTLMGLLLLALPNMAYAAGTITFTKGTEEFGAYGVVFVEISGADPDVTFNVQTELLGVGCLYLPYGEGHPPNTSIQTNSSGYGIGKVYVACGRSGDYCANPGHQLVRVTVSTAGFQVDECCVSFICSDSNQVSVDPTSTCQQCPPRSTRTYPREPKPSRPTKDRVADGSLFDRFIRWFEGHADSLTVNGADTDTLKVTWGTLKTLYRDDE